MRERRLLALSGMPFWPIRDGYALRVSHLVRGLAADWRVTLASPGEEPTAETRQWLGLDAWEPLPSNQIADGGTGSVTDSSGSRVAAIRDRVSALADARRPDALLVWPGTEFSIFDRAGFPPAVGDRIDSSSLTYWRSLSKMSGLRARLSTLRSIVASVRYERRLLQSVATTVVVGEDDAAALRRLAAGRPVKVIPNGVAQPATPDDSSEASRPTVIFTGVLCYNPNVDAVRHFVRDVWPALRADLPDAEFIVAGREPSDEVRRLTSEPGVRLMENVPDMGAVLRQAWIAVAPMCSGAGIKNKILEAWALARPVVMTELASNGLEIPETLSSTVTRSAEQMSRTLVGLLRDDEERKRLGELGRSVTRERHDWTRLAGLLSDVLRRSLPS